MTKTNQLFYTLAIVIAAVASITANATPTGVPVNSIVAKNESITPSKQIVARIESQAHTQITPRISGYLLEQTAADGAMVKAGDVLFKLDDTVYRHNLQLAQAQIKQAKAAFKNSHLHYQRTLTLQGPGVSTQSQLEIASADLNSTKAALAGAKVAADKATYDLNSTIIVAPFDGLLGKAVYAKGAHISPASTLIDIVKLSPINVTFTLDHQTYLKYGLDKSSQSHISLPGYESTGEINYIGNTLNASTGTIKVSAAIDNQDAAFTPNQITYIEIAKNKELTGYWIPQSALIQDLTINYIYIIDEKGTAQRRDVTIAREHKGQVFITQGIENGDQVITDGLIRVRPNAPVSVQGEA